MTTNPETAGVEPVALAACPFCKSADKVRVYDNTAPKTCSAAHAWVGCFNCHCEGPEKDTVAEAVAAWNAHPPAAREDGEAVAKIRDALLQIDNLCGSEIAKSPSYVKELIREALTALATTRPAPEQAPDHANCAVGEGEPTPEPTPQKGLGEELVERVARAIYDVGCTFDEKWEHAHPRTQMTFLAKAEAALATMPTPAAIRAETTGQIVAWLRQRQEIFRSKYAVSVDPAAREIADALERGDHLTGGEA